MLILPALRNTLSLLVFLLCPTSWTALTISMMAKIMRPA